MTIPAHCQLCCYAHIFVLLCSHGHLCCLLAANHAALLALLRVVLSPGLDHASPPRCLLATTIRTDATHQLFLQRAAEQQLVLKDVSEQYRPMGVRWRVMPMALSAVGAQDRIVLHDISVSSLEQ